MPEQCPLHFTHDVFKVQELAKLHYRANLWTCGLCGKSFYREPYLDLHVASKHASSVSFDLTSVCLANFCDVFRCRAYLKLIKGMQKRKNFKESFTQVLASKEDLYDLGINLIIDHDNLNIFDIEEAEQEIEIGEKKDSKQENALMVLPPANILRILDGKSEGQERFVAGLDVQDPYGFAGTEPNLEENKQSRPRNVKDRIRQKIEAKKATFRQELDEVVFKTFKMIETKLGRRIEIFKDTNATNEANEDELQVFDEQPCDSDAMQSVKSKCFVSPD